jgi:hypothetical protein
MLSQYHFHCTRKKCVLSTTPRQNRVTAQQKNSLGRILNNVEYCTWMKIRGDRGKVEGVGGDDWECSEKSDALIVTGSVNQESLLL